MSDFCHICEKKFKDFQEKILLFHVFDDEAFHGIYCSVKCMVKDYVCNFDELDIILKEIQDT